MSVEKIEKYKKNRVGIVVSDKMQKTRVVVVERRVLHPVFKKYYRQKKKYHVHDENNLSHIGDVVEVVESRPLSKLKRWSLKKIIKPAIAV